MIHKVHTGFYQWKENTHRFIFLQSEEYNGDLGELTVTECVSRGLNEKISTETKKIIRTNMNLMMPIEFLSLKEILNAT